MAHKQIFWASMTFVEFMHCPGAGHVLKFKCHKGREYQMYPEDAEEVLREKCIIAGEFTGWFYQESPIHVVRLAEDSEIPED